MSNTKNSKKLSYIPETNDSYIIEQLRDMKRDAKKYDKIDVEELENIYRKSDTTNKAELENQYPWLSLIEIDGILIRIENKKIYEKSLSGKDEWRIMVDQEKEEEF